MARVLTLKLTLRPTSGLHTYAAAGGPTFSLSPFLSFLSKLPPGGTRGPKP